MLGWAALLLFSAIFLHAIDLPPQNKGWQRFWKGVGVVLLLAGAAILVGALAGSRDPLQPLSVLRAQAAAPVDVPQFEKVDSIAELDARLAPPPIARCCSTSMPTGACRAREMERFTFSDAAVAARMAACCC